MVHHSTGLQNKLQISKSPKEKKSLICQREHPEHALKTDRALYRNHRSHNASHTESPKKAKDDGFLVTIYENSMVLANISSWAAPISCTAVRLVRNVLFLAHFFRYC